MAGTKLRITWSDGRVTHVQEPSLCGEVCEYDIEYGRISEGLRLRLKHHERSSSPAEGGGASYRLAYDGYALIVSAAEMDDVVRIEEDGVEMVARFMGDLVVLPLLRAAASIYVTEAPDNFILSVGSLDAAIRCREPGIDDEGICSMAGVTPGILRAGRVAWADHMAESAGALPGGCAPEAPCDADGVLAEDFGELVS